MAGKKDSTKRPASTTPQTDGNSEDRSPPPTPQPHPLPPGYHRTVVGGLRAGGTKRSPEEEMTLIQLKLSGITWKEVETEFAKVHVFRSAGSHQAHYSRVHQQWINGAERAGLDPAEIPRRRVESTSKTFDGPETEISETSSQESIDESAPSRRNARTARPAVRSAQKVDPAQIDPEVLPPPAKSTRARSRATRQAPTSANTRAAPAASREVTLLLPESEVPQARPRTCGPRRGRAGGATYSSRRSQSTSSEPRVPSSDSPFETPDPGAPFPIPFWPGFRLKGKQRLGPAPRHKGPEKRPKNPKKRMSTILPDVSRLVQYAVEPRDKINLGQRVVIDPWRDPIMLQERYRYERAWRCPGENWVVLKFPQGTSVYKRPRRPQDPTFEPPSRSPSPCPVGRLPTPSENPKRSLSPGVRRRLKKYQQTMETGGIDPAEGRFTKDPRGLNVVDEVDEWGDVRLLQGIGSRLPMDTWADWQTGIARWKLKEREKREKEAQQEGEGEKGKGEKGKGKQGGNRKQGEKRKRK